MIEVVCDMAYIPTKWNCWSDAEGEWFRLREINKFNAGQKYRIILPTDLERGIDTRFFFQAFRYSKLNPNDFEFPNYEETFERYKNFYNRN